VGKKIVDLIREKKKQGEEKREIKERKRTYTYLDN